MATTERGTAAELATRIIVAALGLPQGSQINLGNEEGAKKNATSLASMFEIVYDRILKKVRID